MSEPSAAPILWATNCLRWHQMLLAKFPKFDPSWDSEVQAKWLDTFDKLMRWRAE